ncbi:hypothetical protein VTO73DRAFT_14246 [Trametes versicolor]
MNAHASHDHEMQQFGYESTMALSQALRKYLMVHDWAVEHMVNAHVILESGTSMAIARQEPRTHILRIRLACQTTPSTPPSSQRNPATTFRVVDHGFCPIALYAAGSARNSSTTCADILQECRRIHEANLRSPTLNSHYYVGVLPIMYFVDGCSFTQTRMLPIFRPPNNVNMEVKARTVLYDLARYCAYTMGTAFPLCSIDDNDVYFAVPGRCVRSKGKQWTWEALFDDWADYYGGRGERLPGLEELGLTLLPPVAMKLYSTFWMMDADVADKLGIPTAYSL